MLELTSAQHPLNVSSALQLWAGAQLQMLSLMAPIDDTSNLYPALIGNNLSSLCIFYYRK